MKYLIFILLSLLTISCTNNKKLENVLHQQNVALRAFYLESFEAEYYRISEVLQPEDSLAFEDMKTHKSKIVWLDSIYPNLDKSQKLTSILQERQRLKNLNRHLNFIDLNLIQNMEDSVFDSSIKVDLIKAYSSTIYKFGRDRKYFEVIACGIYTQSR